MTKPVKRRKKTNIGRNNRDTNRKKRARQRQFMDESLSQTGKFFSLALSLFRLESKKCIDFFEGPADVPTQALLQDPTPSKDSTDDPPPQIKTQDFLDALEDSEGNFLK